MKNLIIFLLFFVGLELSAQQYYVVHHNLPAFYESTPYFQGIVYKAFAVDSVISVGTDSLFYTFETIRDTAEQPGWGVCVDSQGGSIMGRKILRQSDRTVLFNNLGDSVFIDRNTVPGESWHYYNYPDGDYIEAFHKETVFINVLGVSDSVKVFSLSRKDSEGNLVEDDINDKEFRLSAYHGLTQTFDNYLFPKVIMEQYLAGYSGALPGVKNLDAREAFDFDVGDEFHFKYEDTFWVYDYGDSTYKILSGDIGSKIRIVLGRTDYEDSVTYKYSECEKVKRYSDFVPETIYRSDTTNETIVYDSIRPGLLDAFPDQKIESEYGGTYNKIGFWKPVQYKGFPIKLIVDDAYMDNDSCVVQSTFDPCCYSEMYIKACGGPYFSWADWTGNVDKNDLVYFNKNGVEWGEPVARDCEDLLSDINEKPVRQINIPVYPNPFANELFIENQSNDRRIVQIKLFGINGRLLKNIALHENHYRLNTVGLNRGFYILEIQLEGGTVLRKKLVKNQD